MSETENLFTDGDAYERVIGRWSRVVGKAFLDWLDVPQGLRWVDVGCGNGAFTEELIAFSAPASVTAFDPSNDQLAHARRRLDSKMVDFRIGDAQALPLGDSTVDAGVMALVIPFLPDPAKGVSELMRVVRPGGWVATYMWDLPGGGAPNGPVSAVARPLGMIPPSLPNPAASGREAMRALWEKAGLAEVETHVIRIPITYASFDDFWASNSLPAGPTGTMIHGLPPSEKERLRTHLRERTPIAADGKVVHEAWANAVKGRVPV